jgi:hypothetical protein
MAVKPENTFISGVHKHLPPSVYRMKTNNPYVAGIPDCYYSGVGGDLWVEYKFIANLPVRVPAKIELSALQRRWVEGRAAEGRNVAVIVGSPEGAMIFDGAFVPEEMTSGHFRIGMVSKLEVAEWITERTTKR